MRRALILVMVASAPITGLALEYQMRKGDTLWSISERHLQSPYQWEMITLADGHPVPDVHSIPIGTLLDIPVAQQSSNKPEHISEVTTPKAQQAGGLTPVEQVITALPLKNPSIERIIRAQTSNRVTRVLDYQLTQKDGLVRAWYQGREVVIDVSTLIEEMKEARGAKQ